MLYKILNDDNIGYLNNIGSDWSQKIQPALWYTPIIIASEFYNNSTPYNMLQLEHKIQRNVVDNDISVAAFIDPSILETVSAQVGLMYVSDYGFAAINVNNLWAKNMSYEYKWFDNRGNNWLFNGILGEWTINSVASSSGFVLDISRYGNIYEHSWYVYLGFRPTFYLKSSTTLISGDSANGSINHPFMIS